MGAKHAMMAMAWRQRAGIAPPESRWAAAPPCSLFDGPSPYNSRSAAAAAAAAASQLT
jgi:hypothetical protein